MPDTLITFLEGFEPANEVQTLLRSIVLLEAKLDNHEERDLPLKNAHQNLLNLTKEKYAKLVEVVNENSLEQLTSHIEQVRAEIKTFTSEHEMNSIIGQKINSLNGQLEATKSFIEAKETYGTLKPLDELMEDENALIGMFGNLEFAGDKENTTVDSKVQDLKSAATNQTEFVHGILMFLMIQTKGIDDLIENYGNEELKKLTEPLREAIPEYCMALAVEIGKIHENNNQLS